MKNPADNRRYYMYTPFELSCARDITDAPHLFPSVWVTWANKVIKWYGKFSQVLKLYCRLMSPSVALKCIWENLKKGLSVVAMLRQVFTLPKTEEAFYYEPIFSRENQARYGTVVTFINPKTNKHAFRMRNKDITNRLQSL